MLYIQNSVFFNEWVNDLVTELTDDGKKKKIMKGNEKKVVWILICTKKL